MERSKLWYCDKVKQSKYALLYKITNYVSCNTLKAISFAIFDSHINYANLVWGQNPNSKLRIITLQKKALRILNNQTRNSHSGPLFKKSNILKFEDKILISNIIFLSKSINNLLPSKNWLIIFFDKIGQKLVYILFQRFTIMTQSTTTVNCLRHPIDLTPMVKIILL